MNKINTSGNNYYYNYEWLAATKRNNENLIYEPIERMIYKLSHKLKHDRRDRDIFIFTEDGKIKHSQNYDDYKNACFITLYEYCLTHPNDNFSDTMNLIIPKCLDDTFRLMHGSTKAIFEKDITDTETIKEIPKIHAKIVNPETAAINKFDYELLIKKLNNYDSDYTEIFKLLADGKTEKEISIKYRLKHQTIRKKVCKARKELKRELSNW